MYEKRINVCGLFLTLSNPVMKNIDKLEIENFARYRILISLATKTKQIVQPRFSTNLETKSEKNLIKVLNVIKG